MSETIFDITNGCLRERMCVKCGRVGENCSAFKNLLGKVPAEQIEVDILPRAHVRIKATIRPKEESYESCIENLNDLKNLAEKIKSSCLEYQLKEWREFQRGRA
ncbi:MAG: hypothetical protein LBH81_02195 [Rickettsiales bacterium]|jgi:hypothetical protein|nr:hypothetical protein [Rickettsiales bacterium]